MAFRLALRAPTSYAFNNSLSITARRAYSTSKESNYFTVELSPKTKVLPTTYHARLPILLG